MTVDIDKGLVDQMSGIWTSLRTVNLSFKFYGMLDYYLKDWAKKKRSIHLSCSETRNFATLVDPMASFPNEKAAHSKSQTMK